MWYMSSAVTDEDTSFERLLSSRARPFLGRHTRACVQLACAQLVCAHVCIYACACEGQRSHIRFLCAFLNHSPPFIICLFIVYLLSIYLFRGRHGLSLKLELTNLAGLVGQQAPGIPNVTALLLGSQTCADAFGFLCGCWDPNTGRYVRAAVALSTEPSAQPQEQVFPVLRVLVWSYKQDQWQNRSCSCL